MKGTKYDKEKPRWTLLPFRELEQVVDVLTSGAQKYDDDNWKKVVSDDKDRYFSACMRHLVAWRQDELVDKESKKPHLAHAVCCILFLMWNDNG